ncbi:MAG: NfeD family protein [Leptonema sp. (in: bacteria)]
MKKFFLSLLLLFFPLYSNEKQNIIYKIKINEAITPASMEKLQKAIQKANEEAYALLIELDTPGGLMSSMDEMVKSIMNSQVPVITYVSPPGATCGSAGVFILLSSHVAAMAPATNIGSATPINIGNPQNPSQEKDNKDEEALRKKILNHSIAKIQSIAEYYNRNAQFATETITKAANIPSTKALELKVIDVLAITEEELLQKIDNRKIKTIKGEMVLSTKDKKIVELKDDLRNRLLSVIANPNIAYLLMMIGIAGIMIEIQYPGLIFPGVIGAISLVLGLYGLQTLPVNYAGFLLILLGILFIILEFKIMSYGLLALSGIISILLGTIWIAESMKEIQETSLAVLFTSTFFVVGFLVFVIYKVYKSVKSKIHSGDSVLLSEVGEAITDITKESGKVFIHSEYWNARSEEGIIEKNSKIQPIKREGMVLIVKKIDETKS